MKRTGKACYETHPALPVGDKKIYGGSCITPVVQDAQVYIGLDRGMGFTSDGYPWGDKIEFLFEIPNMGVPKDRAQFFKLVDWAVLQLIADKKVHIGCIGGHGRTGLVLAAIVKAMTGEADAIAYVRKNYCEKAVESEAQVLFLNKHFGITKQTVRQYSDYGNWNRDNYRDYQDYMVRSGSNYPARRDSTATTVVLPKGKSWWGK